MADRVLAAIARFFGREPQVPSALKQLSANPVAMAQVLVLFRMVLADGVVQAEQIDMFETICLQHFGIVQQDMPELHELLESPKARSIDVEAFSLLTQLDTQARTTLFDFMKQIAASDGQTDVYENRYLRRMARMLELEEWPGD